MEIEIKLEGDEISEFLDQIGADHIHEIDDHVGVSVINIEASKNYEVQRGMAPDREIRSVSYSAPATLRVAFLAEGTVSEKLRQVIAETGGSNDGS